MENDANYALVGVISTAIIVALFAFVYWFAGPATSVATKSYNVIFTGTVTGISNGTDVLFNGIKVGQVETITLDPNDTSRVIARIDVMDNTPVKTDTRALLSVQGLTGIGSIQLSGGSKTAAEPVPPPGETIPVLYAEKSDFQSILDGLTTTISGAADTVEQLNQFLERNDAKLSASIDNIQVFSTALAANSDGMQTFLSSLSEAGKQIGPMAGEIRTLSADVRALVSAVPPEQVTKVVGNVAVFTDSLARNSAQIDEFVASANGAAKNLSEIAEGLKPSVATIDRVANQVDQITRNIDPAAVNRVVTNVDKFSTTLGNNSENLNSIVAQVTELSKTLNASATQIDGILSRNAGQIDTFVASANGAAKNLQDVTEGLKPSVAAIDQITKQIDPAAINRVVTNVDKFSTTLGDNSENVGTIVADVGELSKSLNSSAARIDAILARNGDKVDELIASASTAARNVSDMTEGLKPSIAAIDQVTKQIDPAAVNRVVANIDKFSTTLGDNSDDIDTIIADVGALSKSLNTSATRLDGILTRVDSAVDGADDQGMFNEIKEAAKSVRALADQLNASTSQMSVGLTKFTSQGLSEYSALAVDARGTLSRLDRVVRNLEQNPQSLVFGGETVREYNKR